MKKKIFFFACFLWAFVPVFAQTQVAPIVNPHIQLFNAGVPCSGCLLDTFSAGTTTPLVTYSESTGTTPNANPVVADASGFVTVYMTTSSYKLRLRTAAGVTLWTQDNVSWNNLASTLSSLTVTGNSIIKPAVAATGGANQSSPTLCIDGFYFNITSLTDQWCLSDVLGTGTTPTSTFTLTHSGSSGASTFSIPGNETVGGTLGVTTLLSESNVFYCEGQAGADIGAKCNAAYTAGNCATQYCTIRLWKPGPGTKTITITLGNTFTIPVWTYSTTIAFPTPVRFECAGGVWLDYSGSGQAINQGASGATINNRNPLPFIIDGCGFTGGASMSAGIYHNSFVIKSFVKNVNMIGFGNTTAYNIDFQSDNWYSHIQNVWMWSESTNPTCFNGIRINDSSTVPVYDNGDSFVRFLGVHIQNLSGTACTTTVAVNVNSFQPDFQQVDLLGGFHTLVRLRKGANHASFTHFYGETVNSEAGVCGILYGDLGTDPNPAVSNYIDALNAGPDFFINVHNTDLTTTAHAFCPATGTTGTQDWNLNNVVIAQLTAGQPVVVQNNNASQSGNSATGTRVTTGATPLAPGTGVGTSLHTAGGSITRWAGADEQLTSYGDLLVKGQNGSYGATFSNNANSQNYIRVDSGLNADQDSGIEFDSQLAAKASINWSQAAARLTMSYAGTAFFQGNAANTFILKPVSSYNGITTTGAGIIPVYGATTQRSETAADTNVLTFTPPATVGSYRVRFSMDVSAANAATLGWTATWTDSAGNANVPTNLALFQSGAAAPALTFTTSATGHYYGYIDVDVNTSATAIVVKLTFAGTSFTAKVSATVERII